MKLILPRIALLFVIASALLEGVARADLFEVEARHDVMVAMHDGVRLATDLYLPAYDHKLAPGKWPTILMRTPYNKAGDENDGRYFTAHGYAVVFQSTREVGIGPKECGTC